MRKDLFENFNERLVSKLSNSNEICEIKLQKQRSEISRYINATVGLGKSVKKYRKTAETLQIVIDNFEEQVQNVQESKFEEVLKKEEEIKVKMHYLYFVFRRKKYNNCTFRKP